MKTIITTLNSKYIYIWNIEYIEKICQMIRQKAPHMIMILGGPEVTYEPTYFLELFPVDYIISGEGEEVFPQLLEAIENRRTVNIPGVSDRHHISSIVAVADLKYVESLDSPYQLSQDQKDQGKRILYFETSRGCPFQCQYCLSSLEQGLRFFSEDYLKKQLDIICQSPVQTIKFLDRSFNADAKHAIMILDYIFQHHRPGQQFQFEINADVLNQKIIDFIKDYAPQGLLRFEIGIQSTYEPTNRAVKRMQNFERLSEVVKMLMDDGKCAFRAKELQLGFLKLLRGTSLRNQADDYGYVYQNEPPYEMIENKWLSHGEMEKIHMAEDMLEKYWNSGRFVQTMNAVMDHVDSPFAFFYDLACFYNQNHYKRIGYQLDELYRYLDSYLPEQYHDFLIIDYLQQFKVKPKRWYASTLSPQQRKEVIRVLSKHYHLDKELLFRYAVVEEVQNQYLVVIYKDYQCQWKMYKKVKE